MVWGVAVSGKDGSSVHDGEEVRAGDTLASGGNTRILVEKSS